MVRSADFLVEIGTEELPPKALRELELAFAEAMRAGLASASLAHRGLVSFATPRRLAVIAQRLALTQPAQQIEKRGPPLAVAFDAAGAPTRAATAFAEGCGVAVDALERLETPKGAWLNFKAETPGKPAAQLLPTIVAAALAGLPIPRRMRWGAGAAEFVRPVHWVVLLLGSELIPAEILGVTAGRKTRGHRIHAARELALRSPASYAQTLLTKGHVIADFASRRTRVAELVQAAAASLGGTPVQNDALIDEVASLVEWPAPIVGRFPERFLQLPEDVLIATLMGHQRYFPVRDRAGKLLPAFVTLANLESRDPDQVRQGNERVVLPRLTDAEFFWTQDCKSSLAKRADALGTVVYQKGLGSLADKSARIAAISGALAEGLAVDRSQCELAARLAKADLLTQMVGEFPELQGVMGGHYARAQGQPSAVAIAIAEQYLPKHSGDALPASMLGKALSIADRLDTLAGAFALDRRPTGNKDPFGLRRAALGLLRILIEGRVDVDLPALLAHAIRTQPATVPDTDKLVAELAAFITERLRSYYVEGLAPGLPAGAIGPEMFEAVRVRQTPSPLDFHERLLGVHAFMGLPEAISLAAANKRIANILRGAANDLPKDEAVNPNLFEADAERALSAAIDSAAGSHTTLLARRDYAGALRSLAVLRGPVDAFFDAVMVMTDDLPRRRNRLALLGRLRALFLGVADLSLIPPA